MGADRSLLERVMDGAPSPHDKLEDFEKRQPHLYRPSSRDDLTSYDTSAAMDSYLGDLKSTLTPRGEAKIGRWTKSALDVSVPPPPPKLQKPSIINTSTTTTASTTTSDSEASSELECKSPLSPVPPHNAPNLESEDLYQILGIQNQESVGNIRKIFRALAREYHPDRRSNKNDDKAFKTIKEAHDILSDVTRRRFYDKTGFKCEADLMASKGPNGMGGGPQGGPPVNPIGRGCEAAPHSAAGHHMFGAPSPRGHHGGGYHAFGGPPLDPWSRMGDDRSGFGGMCGGMNAHGMRGGLPMGGFISLGGF